LPALRTLPSSTVATLSTRPTSATVAPLPLNVKADERAATRNAATCLDLIRALCVETHEDWLEDKRYIGAGHGNHIRIRGQVDADANGH